MSEETTIIEVESTPIDAASIAKLAGVAVLEPTTAMILKDNFCGLLDNLHAVESIARSIIVTDITQVAEMKKAKELRMAIRKIRLDAEKRKTTLKAEALAYGNAIQGMYNVTKGIAEPLESYLEEQEKFAEVQEAKRKAELRVARLKEMAPLIGWYDSEIQFEAMAEEAFQNFKAVTQKRFDDAEAEAEAERKRIADIEAENERQRIENEKLRKEKEEADRKNAEAIAEAKLKEEEAAKAAARREAEILIAAAAEQRKRDSEAQAKIDEANRKQREAEESLRQQEEAKRKADEAQKRAEAKAAKAPTAQKLRLLAGTIAAYPLPEVDESGAKCIEDVRILLDKIATHILNTVATLERE